MNDKWYRISDRSVRHVWKCENAHCEENTKVHVDPSFYQDNGTPVCTGCDEDMIYQYTEVKDATPDPGLCPECGGKMVFDKGEPMTYNDPGQAPHMYCEDCGMVREPSQEEYEANS